MPVSLRILWFCFLSVFAGAGCGLERVETLESERRALSSIPPSETQAQKPPTQRQEKGVALHPPQIGDFYIFDNPDTEWRIVAQAGDGAFEMRNDSDARVILGRDYVLPPLGWAFGSQQSGERILSQMSGEANPLRAGSVIAFQSTVILDFSAAEKQFSWSCAIGKPVFVALASGQTESLPVHCLRHDGLEIVRYYSKEVGFYVRQKTRLGATQDWRVSSLIAWQNGLGSHNGPASQERFVPSPESPAESPPAQSLAESVTQTPESPEGAEQPAPFLAPAEAVAPFAIHLYSYKSVRNAPFGRQAALEKYSATMENKKSEIRLHTIPGKGEFYRLYFYPYASLLEARRACQTVRAVDSTAWCRAERLQ